MESEYLDKECKKKTKPTQDMKRLQFKRSNLGVDVSDKDDKSSIPGEAGMTGAHFNPMVITDI